MDEELRAAIEAINRRFSAIEARIYAVEFIAANAQATLFATAGMSPAQVKAASQAQREWMDTVTFPSVGAARSDAWAGELQSAMDGLLERIEAIHRMKLGEPE